MYREYKNQLLFDMQNQADERKYMKFSLLTSCFLPFTVMQKSQNVIICCEGVYKDPHYLHLYNYT